MMAGVKEKPMRTDNSHFRGRRRMPAPKWLLGGADGPIAGYSSPSTVEARANISSDIPMCRIRW